MDGNLLYKPTLITTRLFGTHVMKGYGQNYEDYKIAEPELSLGLATKSDLLILRKDLRWQPQEDRWYQQEVTTMY